MEEVTEKKKFIRKYFEFPTGRKEWCVTGEFGSLSFWFVKFPDDYPENLKFGDNGYGGIEKHYTAKSKPDYLGDGSGHESCACNGGKCWHEGSSLWASEYWIPYVLPHGDEYIWQSLENHYDLGGQND